MSHIYDNWERLVAATLKKQQLWELFHQHSRSPSVLSESSTFSSSSSSGKLVFVSDFDQPFDVEDVVLASAKFLGRGLFGSAYVVALGNGVRIVVKRLNLVNVSEAEFKSHMDVVGSVKHENVVALRAYYSSMDERLMLYDHYNKSMYSLLHGRIGKSRSLVDWDTRLTIAIGAARGIAEIHRQNGGKLVHGDIKSSNIFLNAERYGCVSDLGLANIIEATFPSTGRCYAPEVKNTQNISQSSDIYNFGILLLELLTRNSPEVVDLVKLVTSVKSKERATKVFDADLLKHAIIKEQMVDMLRIGIKCLAKSQKNRPKISAVVKMLEDIWMMNQGNRISRKLVFVEDANPTFDLDDMLRASAEVLGEGPFGTSYKTRLGNGETIRMKRMRHVTVTAKDFQRHMEVIGRMRHENVAQLRAYYYSKDKKLLVYDYYDRDSLSALLHGNLGVEKVHLDAETRLNIAIGAARGIAYIHRQDDGKLVHGNIKSSNILIDGRKNSIVYDIGHATLGSVVSPTLRSTLLSPGYCAPEVTHTGEVSQASDVYRFGVVLLELITRRPAQKTNSYGEASTLVNLYFDYIIDGCGWLLLDKGLRDYENEKKILVQLQRIAWVCVKSRPRMSQVVEMLEELRENIEPSIGSRMEDHLLEDRGGGRLEDLLEDMLPTLNNKPITII